MIHVSAVVSLIKGSCPQRYRSGVHRLPQVSAELSTVVKDTALCKSVGLSERDIALERAVCCFNGCILGFERTCRIVMKRQRIEKLDPVGDRQSKIRTIVCFDLDCFYAQVAVKNNPSLRGHPVAIKQKYLAV